jgi:hypothetical protein
MLLKRRSRRGQIVSRQSLKNLRKSACQRFFSERSPLNPKLERYRDSDDELTLDKEDHSERGAAKYFDEDWPHGLHYRRCY